MGLRDSIYSAPNGILYMSSITKLVTLQLLRAYKWAISPLFPPACRFVPTCSEYAMEAVERYGALRGGWMAFARLLRCHPFARSGYDPVVPTAAVSHGHGDSPCAARFSALRDNS
jgi:putative membrane protein insertion efficiency factor